MKPAYIDYSRFFLSPSMSLMIKTRLWLELEALIGFIIGLGLASLLGQCTVALIMTIVLEINLHVGRIVLVATVRTTDALRSRTTTSRHLLAA